MRGEPFGAVRINFLERMIAKWELISKRHYDTAKQWQHYPSIKNLDNDTTLFVRYIGMARDGRTAWDRLLEDIRSRTSEVLAAFLEALTNDYNVLKLGKMVFTTKLSGPTAEIRLFLISQ